MNKKFPRIINTLPKQVLQNKKEIKTADLTDYLSLRAANKTANSFHG